MNKRVWALYIGHLIIAMNEIDEMLNLIQKFIVKKDLSNTFVKEVLSVRLKRVIRDLPDSDPHRSELKLLLQEALTKCDIRNLVAHGSFALDGRTGDQGGTGEAILLSLSAGVASQADVESATQACIRLSDAIELCVAKIRMRDDWLSRQSSERDKDFS